MRYWNAIIIHAGTIDNKLSNRRSCYVTAISITKYSVARARKQLCKNENTFFSVQFQSAKRLRSFSLRVLYFVLIILHPVCKCKMECANWEGRVNGTLQRISTRNFSPTIIPTLQNVKLSIARRDFLDFLATAFCDARSGIEYLRGRLKFVTHIIEFTFIENRRRLSLTQEAWNKKLGN